MTSVWPDPPEAADETGLDPRSDLFFTLIAILLLLLLTLLPGVALTPSETRPLADFDFENASGRAEPFLALRAGLARAAPPQSVPLDAVAASPDLARELSRMAQAGETPVLLIAPDGLEAAFEFEAVAGALGLTGLDQLRLGRDCRPGRAAAAILECARSVAADPR